MTKNNNMKSGSKGTLESEVNMGASCGVSGYMMLILIHSCDASGDSDMEDGGIQEISKNAKVVTKKVHKSTKGGRSQKNASQKKAKFKETIESKEEVGTVCREPGPGP
jgi:hypothetical protein